MNLHSQSSGSEGRSSNGTESIGEPQTKGRAALLENWKTVCKSAELRCEESQNGKFGNAEHVGRPSVCLRTKAEDIVEDAEVDQECGREFEELGMDSSRDLREC